jgi:hypothetical protein
LHPLPKDHYYQVWLKLVPWFLRIRLLNESTPFLHFCNYFPFKEDLTHYLNKLEFLLLKDNLYQVYLNSDCLFWRRFKKKTFSAFSLFCYYLPLERGNPLYLNKRAFLTPPPHPQG